GDAGHQRLTTELAFGADLTRQAGHFRREAVELVHHRVDGLLQLQDLALPVHSDLARQVAACNGGRDLGDVAHLAGEVARHRVDVVGQVLPGTGDSRHDGLATQFALGTHLAGHARHFGGEAVELIDHRIDGLLQLQDLAAHVHGDLARQVAACDGGRHFGDIADLTGQIARHRVDLVGEILPHAADVLHLRLTAQLAFGTDLARHARHFRREAVELVDHRVDGLLQLQDLALHIRRDLARQVAVGDGGRDFRDVAHLAGEVTGHGVHAVGEILPGAGDARHHGLATELAFGAHLARHARYFRGKRAQLIDHRIDGLLQLQDLALHVRRDLARQVAARDGGGDFRDVTDLAGEVTGHGVHVVGQILPGTGDSRHHGLAAELAFGTHFARHTRHLRRERVELIHHRVDGLLQLQVLSAYIDRDLAGQVAVGDGDRHLRDVADLAGEVTGHRVHAVGQVLPGAGDAGHCGLTAELALGTHFARDARDLGGEGAHLLDHRVDDRGGSEEFSLERAPIHDQVHGLLQVALGDRRNGARDFRRRPQQVVDEGIHRGFHRAPGTGAPLARHAMTGLAVLADDLPGTLQLARQALIGRHDLVEGIGYLARKPGLIAGEPNREIPVAYRLQHPQELALVETLRLRAEPAIGLARAALTYLRFHQQAPEWTAPRTGRCRIGLQRVVRNGGSRRATDAVCAQGARQRQPKRVKRPGAEMPRARSRNDCGGSARTIAQRHGA